jgi:lactoylglutathione lyase
LQTITIFYIKKHEEMGCICFENPEMGIYFIKDPDGYWLEILP